MSLRLLPGFSPTLSTYLGLARVHTMTPIELCAIDNSAPLSPPGEFRIPTRLCRLNGRSNYRGRSGGWRWVSLTPALNLTLPRCSLPNQPPAWARCALPILPAKPTSSGGILYASPISVPCVGRERRRGLFTFDKVSKIAICVLD